MFSETLNMITVQKEIDKLMWYVFKNNSENNLNEDYDLRLYGSSLTGLAIRGDADLDYAINLPNSFMGATKILNFVSKGLNGKN